MMSPKAIWDTQMEFLALGSAWPGDACFEDLGSEPEGRIALCHPPVK